MKVQKELQDRHKKALQKWLKGDSNRLYVHNGFDYLRITGEHIETTQAVVIPMAIGKRFWEKLENKTLAVGEKIVGYEVTEVGETVKIGCHTFKTDYLSKFGRKAFK